jgi:hypothetical protein
MLSCYALYCMPLVLTNMTHTCVNVTIVIYVYTKQAAKEVAEFLGTVHHSYQYTIQVCTC